jgi:hypothetical protein
VSLMPANVNLLYLPRPKKHNSPGYQYKEAQDQVLDTKHASVCHKHNVCRSCRYPSHEVYSTEYSEGVGQVLIYALTGEVRTSQCGSSDEDDGSIISSSGFPVL